MLNIKAILRGEIFDEQRHTITGAVKAVTYHQIFYPERKGNAESDIHRRYVRIMFMENKQKTPLIKLDNNRYMIEKHGAMRVDGMVFLDDELLNVLGTDESIKQVENVACLPGIVGCLNGHARYSLGLRFSHRRGRGFRQSRRGLFRREAWATISIAACGSCAPS